MPFVRDKDDLTPADLPRKQVYIYMYTPFIHLYRVKLECIGVNIIFILIFYSNDACRMSGQTRRFKDSRFTGDDDEEEIDGCVAGTAGKQLHGLFTDI